MADKCRKAKGATLLLCEAAQHAVSTEFVVLQNLRNFETGTTRERLALVRRKEVAPLLYCPWCRASIDTRRAQHGGEAGNG